MPRVPSLVYVTSSQVIKPLDKTSFQFYNVFRSKKAYAMNAKSSIILEFLKSIAIMFGMCELALADVFSSHRNRRALNPGGVT